MKAKEVLEETLKQRDDELREYISVFKSFSAPISSFQELIDKRQQLLILELPVKTDTLSVNRSLSEQFEAGTEQIPMTREKFAESYYQYHEKSGKNFIYNKNSYLNLFAKLHPEIVYMSEENGQSVVTYEKALEQDLENPYVIQEIRKKIQKSDARAGTKKVQISLMKRLLERNKGTYTSTPHPVHLKVPLKELAKYISYLEQRCISSDSIQPYKDLIEIKLIFYTDMPSKKMRQIKPIHFDAEKKVLNLGDSTASVPVSFIELVNSVYAKEECLEIKTPKELNKFITQTSGAEKSGLSKPLGIKSIKNAMTAVCCKEHLSLERLPRR